MISSLALEFGEIKFQTSFKDPALMNSEMSI